MALFSKNKLLVLDKLHISQNKYKKIAYFARQINAIFITVYSPKIVKNKLERLIKQSLFPLTGKLDKTVAMLHQGRSGSTVLGNMLDKHPNIRWGGEIFIPQLYKIRYQNKSLDYTNPQKVLRRINEYRKGHFKTNFGFEIKTYDPQSLAWSIHSFLDLIASLDHVKFIYLERKNILKMIVSHLIAYKNYQWHYNKGENIPNTKIYINPQKVAVDFMEKPLLEMIPFFDNQRNECFDYLSQTPFLHLIYENDILNDPAIAYNKVCQFFDVIPSKTTAKLQQINTKPLSEVISNFSEVENTLANTPYAWMCYNNSNL